MADEARAEEFSEHEYLASADIPGPEILKSQIRAAKSEVHGLELTIEDIVADGEKVWARMVGRGRNVRSGRPITMTVIDVCRFEGGRMVEHWGIPDRFAMIHQLGLLPEVPA